MGPIHPSEALLRLKPRQTMQDRMAVHADARELRSSAIRCIESDRQALL
jgi:hypothetical protein